MDAPGALGHPGIASAMRPECDADGDRRAGDWNIAGMTQRLKGLRGLCRKKFKKGGLCVLTVFGVGAYIRLTNDGGDAAGGEMA
ncbi:MAG: hypothetical protein KF849_17835 [Rhizobiaceae bacterium]|nr:hypothetical protein [Rhizobiaceae bacterium]